MDHSFDQIRQLQIRGIKSIASYDLKLKPLNVLIGANGAGKSNFIFVFKLLKHATLSKENFQRFIKYQAGADRILHYGRKRTKEAFIRISTIEMGSLESLFEFMGNVDNNLDSNLDRFHIEKGPYFPDKKILSIIPFLDKTGIYHLNDTTPESKLMTNPRITDTFKLYENFSNLPAFLKGLQKNYIDYFNDIVEMIQRVAPFFEGFVLEPEGDYIRLRWKNVNDESPFDVSALSDGTLRFIVLATILLQPKETLPSLIIIDEPELGLHPQAIQYLAAMLRTCSTKTQIIIATQSVTLLNQFHWKDLIITDYLNGASRFRRLTEDESKTWVEDYSLGELWTGNWLGGVPGWRDD